MKHCIITLLLAVAALAASNPASALDPADIFVSAPRSIFPLLDRNTRLDMIDYFRSGLSNASKNNLDGTSAITALTPSTITIKLTAASSADIVILPCGSDSIVALISTVNTPVPDSKLAIYSSDWAINLTPKMFKTPQLNDWLTDQGHKNASQVTDLVPFMLVSYSVDPDSGILTLTNNTASFLSDDIAQIVAPFFKTNLKYSWNGKRFTLQR